MPNTYTSEINMVLGEQLLQVKESAARMSACGSVLGTQIVCHIAQTLGPNVNIVCNIIIIAIIRLIKYCRTKMEPEKMEKVSQNH